MLRSGAPATCLNFFVCSLFFAFYSVQLSSSGEIAAVVGALQPNGSIDSSFVRVYNTTQGEIRAMTTYIGTMTYEQLQCIYISQAQYLLLSRRSMLGQGVSLRVGSSCYWPRLTLRIA